MQPEAPTKFQGEPSEPAPVPSQQPASSEHIPFKTLATVERYPFRAKIRRAPLAPSVFSRPDAPRGQEAGDDEYFSIFEQLGAISEGDSASASSGPAADGGDTSFGETSSAPIRVPNIEVPSLAAVGRNDAVNGAFIYSGSINRGGAQPTGFGVTRSFGSSLTGVVITPTPGTFTLAHSNYSFTRRLFCACHHARQAPSGDREAPLINRHAVSIRETKPRRFELEIGRRNWTPTTAKMVRI